MFSWWRHKMETFSTLLAICAGGIHRSPVNSPHKGHWRGALMFSLICVWINGWVNNGEAGDLRCYRAHYDVIVIQWHAWPAASEITWFLEGICSTMVMVMACCIMAPNITLTNVDILLIRIILTNLHKNSITFNSRKSILKCFMTQISCTS